jgi:hypothetical protein
MDQISSRVLIEEQVRALSPPQRGLGMIGKSLIPLEKIWCLFFPLVNFIASSQ